MVIYFSRILLLIAGSGVLSYAQDEKAGTVPKFESEIRPIFAANCLTCHGSQMQLAGLDLDGELLVGAAQWRRVGLGSEQGKNKGQQMAHGVRP